MPFNPKSSRAMRGKSRFFHLPLRISSTSAHCASDMSSFCGPSGGRANVSCIPDVVRPPRALIARDVSMKFLRFTMFPLDLHFPTGTVFTIEELVGRLVVRDLHLRRIVEHLLSRAKGDGAEKDRFADRSCQCETARRLRLVLEGAYPVFFAAFDNFLRRFRATRGLTHLAFRKEHRLFTTKTRDDFPLISDEHHSFPRKRLVSQFIRRTGLHTPIVPEEVEGRKRFLLREAEAHDAGVREGDVVLVRTADIAINDARGCTVCFR